MDENNNVNPEFTPSGASPEPTYTEPAQPVYNEPVQSTVFEPTPQEQTIYTQSPESQAYSQSTYSNDNTSDKKNDGFSIASLILGIVGILCGCCGCGFLFNVLAIIFGCVSKKNFEGKKSTLAIVGLVLGVVGLVISIIMIIYFFATGAYTAYMDDYYYY